MSRPVQRVLWFGILALAVSAGGARGAEGRAPQQPVDYNHKVHAEQLGIHCPNCHEGAEIRQRAGFPPDDFCRACHSSPQSTSQKEAKLIELLEAGQPLGWRQVTRVADHVLFSHRRHVAIGNIECAFCHGDMRAQTVPIAEPVVSFQGRAGMFRCIGCHVDSGSPYASTDCVACHR